MGRRFLLAVLAVAVCLAAAAMGHACALSMPQARAADVAPNAVTAEQIQNDDAPTLTGLGAGVYCYSAIDRYTNVVYLVVVRSDGGVAVTPRLDANGQPLRVPQEYETD